MVEIISLKKLFWTEHAKIKMRQYSPSKSKLLRVLSNPKRKEKGIVPKTIALMQPVSRKKRPSPPKFCEAKFGRVSEVWLMYQDKGSLRKIITAWRYPGKSPIREEIPIPEDIKRELEHEYK